MKVELKVVGVQRSYCGFIEVEGLGWNAEGGGGDRMRCGVYYCIYIYIII